MKLRGETIRYFRTGSKLLGQKPLTLLHYLARKLPHCFNGPVVRHVKRYPGATSSINVHLGLKSIAQVAQFLHGGYVSAADEVQMKLCRSGNTSIARD